MDKRFFTFKTSKATLTIIPELCGNIADLQLFNGTSTLSIIDSYQTFDDAEAKTAYKSHSLLPFPNRLKNGQFSFDGTAYQFPINDTNNQHALHGFLEVVELEITNQKTENDVCEIHLKGQHQGLSYFPFPFELTIKYCLSNTELSIQTTIKNIGTTAMPIGYGYHPYFKLDTDSINNLSLQLPDCQLLELDNRMMPTEQKAPYTAFSSFKKIGQTTFDNCFLLNDNLSAKAAILLKSPTTTLSVWQETGENACPFFQIYTPESRKTIAIEPMTCNIDGLNNGQGIWVLSAGEERAVTFGISMI